MGGPKQKKRYCSVRGAAAQMTGIVPPLNYEENPQGREDPYNWKIPLKKEKSQRSDPGKRLTL